MGAVQTLSTLLMVEYTGWKQKSKLTAIVFVLWLISYVGKQPLAMKMANISTEFHLFRKKLVRKRTPDRSYHKPE